MTRDRTDMSEALFDYRLRVSRRARHVYLRVTPEHGLEIVVPRGFNPRHIPELLRAKARWIRNALNRVAARRASLGVDQPWCFPSEIRLPGADRAWFVTAEPSSRRVTIRAQGNRLIVCGRLDDEAACRAALQRWLAAQAREALTPQLEALSREMGLRYRRVTFRRQRSRWGSCTRAGSISLNVKLLFLSPDVVRYVLVHELCHLKEMNHSRRFWALVESWHPDSRQADRRLRDGWQSIPAWAA